MNFLGWPVEHHASSERARRRRRAVALRIMSRFAQTFVGILGQDRHVTVCGGLVRHPAITVYGVSLMLAHETGHHLAGPPFDPDLRFLSWQGQADYWAAKEGMPRVFGNGARRLTLRGAREIAALHAEFLDAESQPDLPVPDRSEIFRAGAFGESPPVCLHRAFDRLLERRKFYAKLKADQKVVRIDQAK
jgi:hypothetical protein